MRQTVFVLVLANGLKLLWTIAQMSSRAPVIEYAPGLVRLINDKTDNLKFLDVLDAIMAERRAGTYPIGGLNENHPRVEQEEMGVLEGNGYCSPDHWSIIAFSDGVIHLDYYQERINDTRRRLNAESLVNV